MNRIDEHEWHAQERALQDERTFGATADSQAPYRRVIRALRQPMTHALPEDFAAQVAALATTRAHFAVDTAFELRLERALTVLLGVSAAVVMGIYGQTWVQAVVASLSGVRIDWTLVLVACIGASWLLDWIRTRAATA